MTENIGLPVGDWTGTVVYEGKTDDYTVGFTPDGAVTLVTDESTGTGTWSATGEDTFSFSITERFILDAEGAAPGKVIPGAAYIEINIDAQRAGEKFTGSGVAAIHRADGSVLHSTTARTSAEQVRAA